MGKDLFGFEKAIQLDHLTKDQIAELLEMFNRPSAEPSKKAEDK
jgi:hypothetical protein